MPRKSLIEKVNDAFDRQTQSFTRKGDASLRRLIDGEEMLYHIEELQQSRVELEKFQRQVCDQMKLIADEFGVDRAIELLHEDFFTTTLCTNFNAGICCWICKDLSGRKQVEENGVDLCPCIIELREQQKSEPPLRRKDSEGGRALATFPERCECSKCKWQRNYNRNVYNAEMQDAEDGIDWD